MVCVKENSLPRCLRPADRDTVLFDSKVVVLSPKLLTIEKKLDIVRGIINYSNLLSMTTIQSQRFRNAVYPTQNSKVEMNITLVIIQC